MKESKAIIWGIIILIILVVVVAAIYFIYKRSSEIGGAVAGTISDGIETRVITNQTGVPANRVDEMRSCAVQIANELGTGQNSGWLGSFGNSDETKIINLLNKAQNSEEMRVMKNLYENTIVPGSNFYSDLDSALDNSEFNRVTHLADIY
jgi:hypothetical protein